MGKLNKTIPYYTPSKFGCMNKHYPNGTKQVLFDGDYDGRETAPQICLVLSALAILIAIILLAFILFLW